MKMTAESGYLKYLEKLRLENRVDATTFFSAFFKKIIFPCWFLLRNVEFRKYVAILYFFYNILK